MASSADVVVAAVEDFKNHKKELLHTYREYAALQVGKPLPVAKFTFEEEANHVVVHGDIKTDNGTPLHLESMQETDAKIIHDHLLSQKSVVAQFADGNEFSWERSEEVVHRLSKRFGLKEGKPEEADLHCYGSFVVSDAETQDFIGMINLNAGEQEGELEMSRLNREMTWSQPRDKILNHQLEAVVAQYAEVDRKVVKEKQYQGVGKTETCALLQYTKLLKDMGYTVKGHAPTAVIASALTTNIPSWKSNAQAGMEVEDVVVREKYGSHPRYLFRKAIA